MDIVHVKSSKPKLASNWKIELGSALKTLGLVDGSFTGKIVLNFNEGGISAVERQERLK